MTTREVDSFCSKSRKADRTAEDDSHVVFVFDAEYSKSRLEAS